MRHLQRAIRSLTELWTSIDPIYAAILRHPFITGLTDGSLTRERFEFYAVQDALYLREFARALAIAAARAPKDDWIIMLCDHAAGALRVERSLHEDFFREFALPSETVLATPPAPTNLAYTNYLLAVAYGAPFHEALAALLPCYWIYWEVGKQLTKAGSPNPLYARWIRTYGADEFGTIVNGVLEATDEVAARLGTAERALMLRALSHDQPLRVAVLGHGLPLRAVAVREAIVSPPGPDHAA
jgi:thiaminase (transcriptional activator TenA)